MSENVHEFLGRSDRGCEVCGMLDRHPVHSTGDTVVQELTDKLKEKLKEIEAVEKKIQDEACAQAFAAGKENARSEAAKVIIRYRDRYKECYEYGDEGVTDPETNILMLENILHDVTGINLE